MDKLAVQNTTEAAIKAGEAEAEEAAKAGTQYCLSTYTNLYKGYLLDI